MKYSLQNIGKINNANINIKPLTIFVGENNTGKTYAASALWAIANEIKTNSEKITSQIEDITKRIKQEHKKIFSLIQTQHEKNEHNYTINIKEFTDINKGINNYIKNQSQSILEKCFNFKGFTSKSFLSIELENNFYLSILFKTELSSFNSEKKLQDITLNVTVNLIQNEKTISTIKINLFSFPIKILKESLILQNFFESEIIKTILGFSYFGQTWEKLNQAIYIPAARTGILLGLNFFIQGSFDKIKQLQYNNNKRSIFLNNFTEPLTSFAESISLSRQMIRQPRNSITSKLISGKVKTNINNSFYFENDEPKMTIPLSATSSMITEVAALDILNLNNKSFIIFEEPEAHLHLSAQREMAKIIIQLVNKGNSLLITTHSDTFLQQINNLILLNDHPKKNELLELYDLNENCILNKEKASAYDFQCKNKQTIVNSLPFEDYGFIAPSLNDVLINLGKQTEDIINTDL